MAQGKMFNAAAKGVKRIPKWAWYVSGGILIAGGIYAVRQRQAVDEPSGDTATDEGMVGYTDASQAPGIIVPAQIGGDAVPAEINTDIPVATLDLIGGVIGDLVGIIGQQPSPDDLLQIIAGAGSPQAGAETPGVVAVAPVTAPKPAPAPKPNPCSKLEGGFHCGGTIRDGNLSRNVGGVGWKRDSSGGTGKNHWIKYRVRHCQKLEIWTVYPNRPGDPWTKTHSQAASNIC